MGCHSKIVTAEPADAEFNRPENYKIYSYANCTISFSVYLLVS